MSIIYFQVNTLFNLQGTFAFHKDTKWVQGHAILMPLYNKLTTTTGNAGIRSL